MASGLALSARAPTGGGMKLAGDAYNSGDFAQAVEHFRNAVSADPANLNAKLFLANALVAEVLRRRVRADPPRTREPVSAWK